MMCQDKAASLRRRILLVLLLFYLGVFVVACKPEPVGWYLVRPASNPPPTANMAVAYDSASAKAVLFGGVTDKYSEETWTWDELSWTLETPLNYPPGRQNHAMAFDASRERVVLFGGATAEMLFDDTWEWDGSSWHLMNPDHTPPARCCHAMAYDPNQQQVVLYGGWDSISNTFLNDTWLWNGVDWSEVTCCNTPLMSGHGMVEFPELDEVISVQTADFGTWAWNDRGWEPLDIESPPTRSDVRLAYDRDYERIALFGGSRNGEFMGDTWIFDGQTWFELDLSPSPPPRFGHVVFYDTRQQRVILFGGSGEEGLLNDTWVLNLPEDLAELQQ